MALCSSPVFILEGFHFSCRSVREEFLDKPQVYRTVVRTLQLFADGQMSEVDLAVKVICQLSEKPQLVLVSLALLCECVTIVRVNLPSRSRSPTGLCRRISSVTSELRAGDTPSEPQHVQG